MVSTFSSQYREVSTFLDIPLFMRFPHFQPGHHSRAENVETSKVRRQNDKQSGIKNEF